MRGKTGLERGPYLDLPIKGSPIRGQELELRYVSNAKKEVNI